jgi:hypothetical protein
MSRNLRSLTVVLHAYMHESNIFVSRDEFRILYRRLTDEEQTCIIFDIVKPTRCTCLTYSYACCCMCSLELLMMDGKTFRKL